VTRLIDSSAWIEYLRGGANPVAAAVRHALDGDTAATTDIVVLEVLAGSPVHRTGAWSALLARCSYLTQQPWDDADAAAAIYRACRRGGHTPRGLADCLIAAIAIRYDVAVLAADKDFDAIAQHTPLQVVDS
jgi:predicted nucleic acid-binding protein